MPTKKTPNTTLDWDAHESRQALTKMIVRLFRLWKLSTADQLNLLGLSENSRSLLSRYAGGEAQFSTQDMKDRARWLLAIHKSLRLLYPENDEIYELNTGILPTKPEYCIRGKSSPPQL